MLKKKKILKPFYVLVLCCAAIQELFSSFFSQRKTKAQILLAEQGLEPTYCDSSPVFFPWQRRLEWLCIPLAPSFTWPVSFSLNWRLLNTCWVSNHRPRNIYILISFSPCSLGSSLGTQTMRTSKEGCHQSDKIKGKSGQSVNWPEYISFSWLQSLTLSNEHVLNYL